MNPELSKKEELSSILLYICFDLACKFIGPDYFYICASVTCGEILPQNIPDHNADSISICFGSLYFLFHKIFPDKEANENSCDHLQQKNMISMFIDFV